MTYAEPQQPYYPRQPATQQFGPIGKKRGAWSVLMALRHHTWDLLAAHRVRGFALRMDGEDLAATVGLVVTVATYEQPVANVRVHI